MTCTASTRAAAEVLADILGCENAIRNTRDAGAVNTLRRTLRELVWEQTLAIDREERARIEALYPLPD